MKNKEKHAREIIKIACDGNSIAVVRSTGELRPCCEISCGECLFNTDTSSCSEEIREWAEAEHVERPVISKRDRAFLEYLSTNIQYMARDMSDRLYIYPRKPYKQVNCWSSSACETEKALWMFNIDFPMVKWEDDEPWLIDDLKKLEVVDSYE